jgi:hypothetical protein
MESSTSTTEEFDSAGKPTQQGAASVPETHLAPLPAGAETRVDPLAATTETHIAPLPISRERCSVCGATLASDQRYCVECGQRCGAPRLPFTEGLVQRAQQAPSSRPRSGRSRVSVNNTVIAGVGTLLLAMGIGVLIGRSGSGSNAKVASPPVQVVTVPGAGVAATSGTESQTSTGATGTTKSTGAASSTSATKSAGQASKKAAAPPAKTVTVGSPGKGPGYEKGHFTGNFFGK